MHVNIHIYIYVCGYEYVYVYKYLYVYVYVYAVGTVPLHVVTPTPLCGTTWAVVGWFKLPGSGLRRGTSLGNLLVGSQLVGSDGADTCRLCKCLANPMSGL